MEAHAKGTDSFNPLQKFQFCFSGYLTATPLPSFVDGEKTSWLRLRSPSEDAVETVQSWKDSASCYFAHRESYVEWLDK